MTIDLPPAPPERHGWPWTAQAGAPPTDSSGLPRITVVTPSYNQGQFLEATLRSVLLQGYPNLEYFVIDGGSTDNSVEIIRRYAPHLDYWESERDRGQTHAIMKGFARASGAVLAWLNSDDMYLPGALQTVGAVFAAQPQAGLVYGAAQHIEPSGEPRPDRPCARPYERRWMLEQSNMVPQPAAFVTAKAYHAAGGLVEARHWLMDWDLWLRMGEQSPPVFVARDLAQMRIYAAAKFQSRDRKLYAEFFELVERHGHHTLPKSLRQRLIKTQLALADEAAQRGDLDAARDELDFVLETLPDLQDSAALAATLARYAWQEQRETRRPALDIAAPLVAALPARLHAPREVRGLTLGLVHEALAFEAARQGQPGKVWQHTGRAFGANPRQLRNRGLWSLAARSLFGRRPAGPPDSEEAAGP